MSPAPTKTSKIFPKKLSIKRRKRYQQKRLYCAPIILSDSELSSLSNVDDEVVWSRDAIPEASGFLSKVGERRPSGDSMSAFPMKSPSSPGLYMQCRKLQLPDITHTMQETVPETVPLAELSHRHSNEDKLDKL